MGVVVRLAWRARFRQVETTAEECTKQESGRPSMGTLGSFRLGLRWTRCAPRPLNPLWPHKRREPCIRADRATHGQDCASQHWAPGQRFSITVTSRLQLTRTPRKTELPATGSGSPMCDFERRRRHVIDKLAPLASHSLLPLRRTREPGSEIRLAPLHELPHRDGRPSL